MSSLLDRSAGLARTPGADAPPSALAAACTAALRALGTGLLPILLPVVLAWVLGAGGRATWSQTIRLAAALWLLAHHTGLAVTGGHVGLVPLGLAVFPLLACWFAGRRLARSLDERADLIEAGATRAAPAALSWRVLLVFAGLYCVLACLVSVAASMSELRPVSGQALVGAAVVSLVGGGLGAGAYRHRGARSAVAAVLDRVPRRAAMWMRPAAAALAAWIGSGAAVVAVLLIAHHDGVIALHEALDAGALGGAVLTFGELALLPNLIVWACAATAGPGITLGSGASITLAGSALGPLPAIPVLAALPGPGPLPGAALTLLALPLLGGVAAGWLILTLPARSLATRTGHVAGTAALCGLAAALLAWLSGGPAGPGRLAQVGPDPVLTGIAFAAEVALGAGAVVLVSAAVPVTSAWVGARRQSRRDGERPVDDEPAARADDSSGTHDRPVAAEQHTGGRA